MVLPALISLEAPVYGPREPRQRLIESIRPVSPRTAAGQAGIRPAKPLPIAIFPRARRHGNCFSYIIGAMSIEPIKIQSSEIVSDPEQFVTRRI